MCVNLRSVYLTRYLCGRWLDDHWLHSEGLWCTPANRADVLHLKVLTDERGEFPIELISDCHIMVSLCLCVCTLSYLCTCGINLHSERVTYPVLYGSRCLVLGYSLIALSHIQALSVLLLLLVRADMPLLQVGSLLKLLQSIPGQLVDAETAADLLAVAGIFI